MRPWSWFGHSSGDHRRRILVAMAALMYVATTLGVPFPKRVSKRSSERFPCEEHPCGCATARDCWENCCCYTPRQKLAWARAHGVTPPAYVFAQVERESPRACCKDAHATASCCKSHRHTHDHEPAAEEGHTKIVWAFGNWTRQCRGMAEFWSSCTPGLPPVMVSAAMPHPVCERIHSSAVLPLEPEHSPPPVPPPEAHLSC